MTTLEDRFSKDTIEFLEIKDFFHNIEPSSYYGKMYFKNPRVFLRGEETELKTHYGQLSVLEEFLKNSDINKIKRYIRELKNIQSSVGKIKKDDLPNVVDLFEIKRFCYFYRRLFSLLCNDTGKTEVNKQYKFISTDKIWTLMDPKGNGQFFFSIDSDYAIELRKELERYRALEKESLIKISERLQQLYELSVSNRVEFILQRSDMRNQGLKKCDNVIIQDETAFSISYKIVRSEKDKDYSFEIEHIEMELSQEDIRYRTKLKESLKEYVPSLENMMDSVTILDKDVAIVEFKRKYDCSYPQIENGEFCLEIEDGKNLKIKDFCDKNFFDYDCLTIELRSGSTLITGANMGGKTSALKTIGQIYIQCALGLAATAKHVKTSLFDGINCVFRTSEEEGLSGFAMEVKRINNVFNDGVNINLIDEFGSATNPREGSSLSSATVAVLDKDKSLSIFVTHFSKPLEFGSVNYQTGFLKEELLKEIDADNIYRYIDHHLKKIDNNEIPKAAIQISRVLGMPIEVVKKAEEIYEGF